MYASRKDLNGRNRVSWTRRKSDLVNDTLDIGLTLCRFCVVSLRASHLFQRWTSRYSCRLRSRNRLPPSPDLTLFPSANSSRPASSGRASTVSSSESIAMSDCPPFPRRRVADENKLCELCGSGAGKDSISRRRRHQRSGWSTPRGRVRFIRARACSARSAKYRSTDATQRTVTELQERTQCKHSSCTNDETVFVGRGTSW